MQVIQSPHRPVCVAIPSATLTRYVLFETSLEGLFCPQGSQMFRIQSASAAKNRNDAIRLSDRVNITETAENPPCQKCGRLDRHQVDCDMRVTHYFFMDDDHHFNMELLMNLLKHNLPIVCTLTSFSKPPFIPVLYKGDTKVDGKTKFINIPWQELDGRTGLYPVFAAAGAGILVTRAVIEKIPEPWFELGHYDSEQCGEDMYFYEKVRNLGVAIYVDLDAVIGHFAHVAAWPYRLPDGRWTIMLVWENGQQTVLGRSDSRMNASVVPSSNPPEALR